MELPLQEIDLDKLTEQQNQVASCFTGVEEMCGHTLAGLEEAIALLDNPGILFDSQVVRFFALLDVIRKAVKKLDDTVGRQIDGETQDRSAGRLQALVAAYFEKIGESKAYAAGRCVHMKHVIRASATDIARLKRSSETRILVKDTVNSNSLTSWVNELDKDPEGLPILPNDVKDGIKIIERFPISTTKAG